MSEESFGFDADIQQLLHLIITAFYSDKSVFLRELVSNASDALDKVRLQSLTDASALATGGRELRVRVIPDAEAKTLTIQDSGVGMTREELIRNLGTVARSGTKAFMEAMQKGVDSRLIGQFGVGFYSAFLVADRVSVTSKHNSERQAHVWTSRAQGSFTVAAAPAGAADDLGRGTRVVLHLKEGMGEYLEEQRLRALLGRHCSFIGYPIELLVKRTEEVEAAGGSGAPTETQPAKADEKGEERKAEKEKREVMKYEQVNGTQPVWMKSPSEVTEDEYRAFYKAISNDWDDYAAKRHFRGEGTVEFQALLYVPKHPPFDMLMGVATQGKQRNVKLYARKVLILDEFDDFLPPYLCFVKGVVNSDDIPLNVSRELLQDNKMLKFIARNLVRRCLEMFVELAEDDSAYKAFYNAFSTNLKLGIHDDTANRGKLLELLRFPSNKTLQADASSREKRGKDAKEKEDPMAALMGGPQGHQGSVVSLKEYVDRMADGQEEIYVITGESVPAVDGSPFMEKFKELGLEVLYLAEPIDEYVLGAVQNFPYEGKKIVNITKDGVKLPGAKKEEEASAKDETGKPVKKEEEKPRDLACELAKKVLEEKVDKVELSDKLVQSACALQVPEFANSANMERILRAQALQSQEQRIMLNPAMSRRTLLLNPGHRLVAWLRQRADAAGGPEKAAEEEEVRETVQLLFDSALLSSGFALEEPTAVAARMQALLVSKL